MLQLLGAMRRAPCRSHARWDRMRLEQQQLQVQAKIDKAYDDRLAGAISEEMWRGGPRSGSPKFNQVRGDMARLEDASRNSP